MGPTMRKSQQLHRRGVGPQPEPVQEPLDSGADIGRGLRAQSVGLAYCRTIMCTCGCCAIAELHVCTPMAMRALRWLGIRRDHEHVPVAALNSRSVDHRFVGIGAIGKRRGQCEHEVEIEER
jgi:hypothetical protein